MQTLKEAEQLFRRGANVSSRHGPATVLSEAIDEQGSHVARIRPQGGSVRTESVNMLAPLADAPCIAVVAGTDVGDRREAAREVT